MKGASREGVRNIEKPLAVPMVKLMWLAEIMRSSQAFPSFPEYSCIASR
jgi:hypothetical protein